ncbi:MAG TPA: hypothetical protein DCR14_08080 [Acidimicrobiaceae bacterium]|nr:hypothetical protein [Acidimicrobiaceae bacterium]
MSAAVRSALTGVRGRVTFAVLAVTAVLYSLLGTIGFVAVANGGRDAIRDRINTVLDEFEAGLQSSGGAVRFDTADGVHVEVLPSSGLSVSPAPEGTVEVWRIVEVDGRVVELIGWASEARLTESLRSLYRGLWIAIPLAAIVSAIIAGVATRRALRPVGQITALAASIDGTVSAQRVPEADTDDEVHHLAVTLNGMLDRLAAAATAQRQFTSDAAHELRTPLMALQGELELAVAHGAPRDDAFVDRLQALAQRLGERIDDLVLLSTLDEGRPTNAAAASLHDVVQAEAALLTPSPTVTGVEGITEMDTTLAARAVRNLLANAQRHAAATVTATVEHDDGKVWLHVDDDGPGIPLADRADVFRRFSRLDEARSTDRGGAGLGLAIVASVADAHGGGVQATDSPLGGARLSLWLPLVSAG